jgi:hypothetical protein
MAAYGKGQMLGSGINPESFKQDYSGFTRAAEIQAQGLQNLGQSIGGAIESYGEMKKRQQEDERAVQKSKNVAKAIGDLIPDLKPAIQNSLTILDNKELPLSQRKAEAEAISDILNLGIGEISNRQNIGLKKRELDIKEAEINARNKPQSSPLTFTPELLKTGGGDLAVKIGSDGNYYDESGQFPITDFQAYAEGQPPEVYSSGARQSAANAIDAGLTLPAYGGANESPPVVYGADGMPMLLPPPVGTFDTPNPLIPIDPSVIDAGIALNAGQAAPVVGEPPASIALPKPAPQLKSRIIPSGEDKQVETFRPATAEESALYGGVPGQMSSKGRFYPINLPPGMTIETDPSGRLIKVVQGAGVGSATKGEAVAKAQQQMKNESFRLIQANTEEARNLLDKVGTSNPLFAAGNAALASALPASQAGEMQTFFARINGENSFQKMNQLRASSPTGGAAGTMTEKEWPRFEGRFFELKANAKQETLAKALSLNLLNAFEAANGTPQDVIKLLEDKKIDQATYDNYVNEYMKNREIARVGAGGVSGAAYDWTKLNKDLLNKSTIFEEPASTTNSGSEEIYKKHGL